MDEKVCPIHGLPLKKYYSGCGGKTFLGCSKISCDYQEEIIGRNRE